jgi:hypothetical protein
MSGIEWMVVAGGVAAITWVNWYFFVAAQGAGSSAARGETDTTAARE